MCAFPENQTCDLGVVRVMLYQLNYRNTLLQVLGNLWVIWYESIYFSQNLTGMCTGFLPDHNLEPTENYTTVFYRTSTKHKPESVSFRTHTVVWVFILSSQIKCPCKYKVKICAQPKRYDQPGTNNRFMRPRMPVKYTQNKLYLMFNHYRDIRARGKCRKD